MPLQTTFGTKVTDTSSTQLHPLNTLRIEGACIYKYVKANEAIDQYDAVTYTAAGTVADAFASGDGAVGVAPVAIASGYYGWIQCSGPLTVTGLTAAVGAKVYGTAATGVLTTTSTSNSAYLGFMEVANSVVCITCM